MKRERRTKLRLNGQVRIIDSLAEVRARRDIETICKIFAGDRA
jgi:hypothetical protein